MAAAHGVAGVVEGLVAAGAAGEGARADDAERDRGDRRREHRAGGVRDRLRRRDQPEAGTSGTRASRSVTRTAAATITAACARVRVDQRAGRRLRQMPATPPTDITTPIAASFQC